VRPGDTVGLPESTPRVTARVVWQRDDRRKLLGQGYGPRRPRDETATGVFNTRYDPQNSGYAGAAGAGELPFADWQFEDEHGFGGGTAIQEGVMVVSGRGGSVYGLDPVDGAQLWEQTVRGSTGGTPVVADGRVYVRQFTRKQSGLVALDLFDGGIEWRVAVPQQRVGQPVVTGDSILTATTGGPAATSAVHSFDTTDALPNWSTFAEEFAFPAYTAAVEDSVFAASTEALLAIDRESGTEQWRFAGPDDDTGSFWGPIVVDGGPLVAFFGTRVNRLYRLGPNGTQEWEVKLVRSPSTLPVTGRGRLFVPVSGSDVIAYDLATGEQEWRYFTTDPITALTATKSYLYAVETDTIRAVDPAAGEELGSNAKPGEEIRAIVATEGRLFTVGSSVIGYEGPETGEQP